MSTGTVTWILANGQRISAAVAYGDHLMGAAQIANVPEILGSCGGTMSCATCHVVVDPAWRAIVGGPGDFEDAMLDMAGAPRQEGSRLSCQIEMSAALDGLVLRVPT